MNSLNSKVNLVAPLSTEKNIYFESIPINIVRSLFPNEMQYQFYNGIKFEVRAYSPTIFHSLRLLCSMQKSDLLKSINPINNAEKITAEVDKEKTAGNSGSEILFTSDKRFLIKSMKAEEKALMIQIVADYVTHIVKNEKSLIAKIYGIFSVSIERREPMYYLLLENLDPFQK